MQSSVGRGLVLVFLAGVMLVPRVGGAACTDQTAVTATRTAADTACTLAGNGCSNAKNHGQYVKCVAAQAKQAVTAGTLPKECKGAVVKCAARSTCGKPGFVTCCVTKAGTTKCGIKSSATACKAPKGGTACVGSHASCCDACTATGCASPSGAFVSDSTVF